MNVDWQQKIIAFLHDPPDKILGIENHEGRALVAVEALIGTDAFRELFGVSASELQTSEKRKELRGNEVWQRVKKADAIASAMDRAAFPRDVTNPWSIDETETAEPNLKAVVKHPLSGRSVPLTLDDTALLGSVLIPAISGICSDFTSDQLRERYLRLWRQLPDLPGVPSATPEQRRLWRLLPADSRIVDHTVWNHLDMTAALVTALPQPALLVCAVGPVQDFIRTARRTQDLWMGSYILSYLAWRGMEVIAQNFGPDAVVYPSLRGQPLVDHWLAEQGVIGDKLSPADLTRATLPNKFVALLPAAAAKATANHVADAINKAWSESADAVAKWLTTNARVQVDNDWHTLFNTHKRQMPEIYWSIHRWPNTSTSDASEQEAVAALDEVRRLLHPPHDWEFGHTVDVYRATAPRMVNIGTVYSQLHELAQRGFAARKCLRNFTSAEEDGEICSLCGERSALRRTDERAREFWKEVATNLRGGQVKGEYVAVKPQGRERLCGVCTVKRFIQRSKFELEYTLHGGFPSTSSVATAPFKAAVLAGLCKPDNEKLLRALRNHQSALQHLRVHRISARTAANMLPHLDRKIGELTGHARSIARRFLCYDGELFYEETLTVERLRSDYDLSPTTDQSAAARRTLHDLLSVCADMDIAPPAKYFAVLAFDGDNMGRWLSGDQAPLFAQALHPEAEEQIRGNYPTWNPLLDAKRVLSPALHAAISSSLANFALHVVPRIVEQEHCGRVVYAGGDDLLALVPVDQVLAVARKLRAFYSGEVSEGSDTSMAPAFGRASCTGYLPGDSMLLTMGPTATASVGIAIAHHLSPLDATLGAAYAALHDAKEKYGRNALCVRHRKRSGEEVCVGARWFYADWPLPQADNANDFDVVRMLVDIQDRFFTKKISMRFAQSVFGEAGALSAVPAAQRAELSRMLDRHRGSRLPQDERKTQPEELSGRLQRLAQSLDAHFGENEYEDIASTGMGELARWLGLLRSLAQGGGRD